MTGQASQSRWYVHRNGETAGPYDEQAIIGWIKNGMRDAVVRPEMAELSSPWLPLAAHAAFAAALLPGGPSPPAAGKPPTSTRTTALGLVLLAVVGLAVFLWLRALMGERGVEAAFATAVRAPIEVENQIVSVPALHCRGVPIQLPYAGDLSLEVNVVKGKHVNVYVLDASDWSQFEKSQTSFFNGGFHHYPAFQSTRTAHARTSGPLGKGAYYVVLENPTLGLLVASSFDVEVKARLQP